MTMAAMVVKQLGGTIAIGCTADRRIQPCIGTEYNGFLLFEADEINSFLD